MTRTPFLDAHYKTRTWTEIQPSKELTLQRLPESDQLTLDTYSIDSGRARQRDKLYGESLSPSVTQRLLDRRDDVIWDLELLECDPELIGCGGYAVRTHDGLLLIVYTEHGNRYFLARDQR